MTLVASRNLLNMNIYVSFCTWTTNVRFQLKFIHTIKLRITPTYLQITAKVLSYTFSINLVCCVPRT